MIEYIKKASTVAGAKEGAREPGKVAAGAEVRVLHPTQLHVA